MIRDISSIRTGDADALDPEILLDSNTVFILTEYDRTGAIIGYTFMYGFENIPNLRGGYGDWPIEIEAVWNTQDNTFEIVYLSLAVIDDADDGDTEITDEKGYVFVRRSTYGIAVADNRWVSNYSVMTADGKEATIKGATNYNGYWTTQKAASDADFDLGLYAYEVKNGYYSLAKVDTTDASHIIPNLSDNYLYDVTFISSGDAKALDDSILLDDETRFIIVEYDKTGAITGYSCITGVSNIPDLRGNMWVETVWNTQDSSYEFVLILGAIPTNSGGGSGGGPVPENQKGYALVRSAAYGGQIADNRWVSTYTVIMEDGTATTIKGATSTNGYWTTQKQASDADYDLGLYAYEIKNGYYALAKVDSSAMSHLAPYWSDNVWYDISNISAGDANAIDADILLDSNTQFIIAEYDKTGAITGYSCITGVNNIPDLRGNMCIEAVWDTDDNTFELILILGAIPTNSGGGSGGGPVFENQKGYVFVRRSTYGGQIADNRWVSTYTVIMEDGTATTIKGATSTNGYWTTQKEASDADYDRGLYAYEVKNGYYALYKVDNTSCSHIIADVEDYAYVFDGDILCGDADALDSSILLDDDTVFIIDNYDRSGAITDYSIIAGFKNIPNLTGYKYIECVWNEQDWTIDFVLVMGARQETPSTVLAQDDNVVFLADTIPSDNSEEYDTHAVIVAGKASTMNFAPNTVYQAVTGDVCYPIGFYKVSKTMYKTGYVLELTMVAVEEAVWRAEGVLIVNSEEYVTLADGCKFYNITGKSVSAVSYADVKNKLDGEICHIAAYDEYGHATVIYVLNLK